MSAKSYGVYDEYPPHIPYVLSNWCYCDALDGDVLRSGDVLDIVWADGTSSREEIVVERDSESTSDMGHACKIPITKAYATTAARGTTARIRLVTAGVKSAVLIKRALSPYEEAYNQVRSAIEKRRAALKEQAKEPKP